MAGAWIGEGLSHTQERIEALRRDEGRDRLVHFAK